MACPLVDTLDAISCKVGRHPALMNAAGEEQQASKHCCIIHEVHIVSSSIHGEGTSTHPSRASSSSLPSPYCCNVLYRPPSPVPPSSHPRTANNQKHGGGGEAVMCLRGLVQDLRRCRMLFLTSQYSSSPPHTRPRTK